MAVRYARGTLRLEGRMWVLRIRLEAQVEGARRPEKVIQVGPARELKTRAAARLEADRRLALMGIAGRLEGRRALFTDYQASYLTGHVSILKASTRAAFKSYSVHLARELKGKHLDEISLGVVQQLVAALSARNLARPTIHAIVSFLVRMLRAARADGLATMTFDLRDLRLPKESRPKQPPRCFTIEETGRILAAAEWPWKALYAVQAYAGLRVGEALGLEWRDFDFEARIIQVRQQASRGRLASTKSANSAAPLPLADELAEILQAYRRAWAPNDRGLLFATPKGKPYWAEGVRRNHLQKLLKRLGLPRAGFHSWRHGLATEAFRAGVGAVAVRRLLRHGSINTTLKYSAIRFDDLVAGSKTVAAAISRGREETQGCAEPMQPNTEKSGSVATESSTN